LLCIPLGEPNESAFAQTFKRSWREEEYLDAWLFNAVREVQDAAYERLNDYNEFRPHASLGSVPSVCWSCPGFST
jgi:putative transposase